MDNEKWTHEVKNNDLADGLEDCKIFENILDNNLDKKTEENKNEKDGEITIEYIDKNPVDNSNDNDLKMEEQNQKYDEEGITILEDTTEEDDDDGLLFLNKTRNEEVKNKEPEIDSDSTMDEIIKNEEVIKKENLLRQREWAMDLAEFPVEKKIELEIEDNKEDSTDVETKEENESRYEDDTIILPAIEPISPELAVDIENNIDIDIVKPKNFNELISTRGVILNNYISGNAKFNSISENLGVCIELCKLFASVHSMGYCFNGITGEDIIITQNKECKLLNNKKIVSVNDDSYEVNYEKTCAPEILRKESRPNINSDKHTMAYIVFGLLFKSDPFEGSKTLNEVYYTKEDQLKAYEHPVFVYSYKDKSNMPVYGIHSILIKYWNRFYSDDIKMIFRQSFVDGIDEYEARLEDTTFIEMLTNFKHIVDSKNTKQQDEKLKLQNKKENILQKTKERLKQGFDDIKPSKNHDNKDFEEKQNIIEINKDAAKKPVEGAKYMLRIDYSYAGVANADCEILPLTPGVEISNNIIGYEDIKPEKIVGKVIQNAKHKGVIGIKNISEHNWLATKGDREVKEFSPGKVIVITEGVKIDFYPENKSISKTKWSIVKA